MRRRIPHTLAAMLAAALLLAPASASSASATRPACRCSIGCVPSYVDPFVGPRELDFGHAEERFETPLPNGASIYQVVIPSSSFAVVMGVDFVVQTDATVANRLVRVEVVLPQPAPRTIPFYSPAPQTATQVVNYHFDVNATTFNNPGTQQTTELPRILLPPGTIVNVTLNKQAGDAFQGVPSFRLRVFPQRKLEAVAALELVPTPLLV